MALRRALDAAPIAILPQDKQVDRFAFSPDSARLVTVAAKESAITATLWDARNGRKIQTRQITGRPVGLAFRGDAPLLAAVGSMTNTVQLWDLASGRELTALTHDNSVNTVLISPSGAQIVTSDGRMHVWDLMTGQDQVLTLPVREGTYLTPLAVSPDGGRLATYSGDVLSYWESPTDKESLFQVWDVATGDEVARLEASQVNLSMALGGSSVAEFSGSGNLLAFGKAVTFGGNQSGTNVLWDLTTGKTRYLGTGVPERFGFSPHDEYIFLSYLGNMQTASGTYVAEVDRTSDINLKLGSGKAAFDPTKRWLATPGEQIQLLTYGAWAAASVLNQAADELLVSPDASRLAATSYDRKTVWLWDVSPAGKQTFLRQQGAFQVIVPGPNNARVVTWDGDRDGEAHLWDVDAGVVIATLPAEVKPEENDYLFSPDGALLAVATDDAVELWDAVSGRQKDSLNLGGQVERQVFSPDGASLAIAAGDTVTLWDVARAASRCTVQTPGLKWHLFTDSLPPLAFSYNGNRLATAGAAIKVWDTADCTEIASLIHEDASRLVFTSTGDRLNSLAGDTAKSWDTTTWSERLSVESPNTTVETSPSGLRWTTRGLGVFEAWDVLAGQRLSVFYHENASAAVFNPDARLLATGGSGQPSQAVRIWDTDTGQAQRVLGRAGEPLAFSPDQAVLATSAGSDSVRLWDVGSGSETAQLNHASDPSAREQGVWSASFSSDGIWLVTHNKDDTARLWRVSARDLIALACQTVTRNLTIEEWERYMSGQVYRQTCSKLPIHPTIGPGIISKANELARAGDIEQALTEYRRALEVDPALDVKPEAEVAKALVEYGAQLARDGHLAEAVPVLKQALALDPSLAFKPEAEAKRRYAPTVVHQANGLAEGGHLGEAKTKYEEALALDPTLTLDPKTEPGRLYAPAVMDQARQLAWDGELQDAIAKYREAAAMDPSLGIDPPVAAQIEYGVNLVGIGHYAEAMNALDAAQAISPTLDITATLPAVNWSGICRDGSLDGSAATVLPACERAVALGPEDGDSRSNRGLARALTGDVAGAITDFEFAVAWAEQGNASEDFITARKAWIAALKAGQKPFDEETLLKLRGE